MLDMLAAPVLTAASDFRPMPDADSALLDLPAAPVAAAAFDFAFLRTPLLVMPHAYLEPTLHEDQGANAKPLGY